MENNSFQQSERKGKGFAAMVKKDMEWVEKLMKEYRGIWIQMETLEETLWQMCLM